MKHTYTKGTTPKHIIEECLPHKYKMELNRNDMLMLLLLLSYVDDRIVEAEQDWLDQFRSSILETIGIEEI